MKILMEFEQDRSDVLRRFCSLICV